MVSYKGIFARVFEKTLRKTGVELLKKTSMFGVPSRESLTSNPSCHFKESEEEIPFKKAA